MTHQTLRWAAVVGKSGQCFPQVRIVSPPPVRFIAAPEDSPCGCARDASELLIMRFPKKFPVLALTGCSSSLLLFTAPAMAEGADAPVSEMETIVVTGTAGPMTIGESLSSVTVIREEDIKAQNPAELQDLLRGQPGIDIVSNGSFGKNTSVYTRGTGSDSTVFMIDGIRLRSATSGGAPWQFVPVELVERIEIVRGPRSSLYGADAVGGVVQAFTVDPRPGQHGWIEGAAGNFDTQRVNAGVAVSTGRTRLSLNGLHKESDGAPLVEGGEDQGYRNSAGVARMTHEFDNGGEAALVFMESTGNTEFEGGETDFTIRTAGFRLDTPVSDYWRSSIQFSEARDEQDNVTSYGASTFNTQTRTGRWENTLTMNVHEWVLGAELQDESVESTTAFDENSRSNSALFSQLRLHFGPTDVQLSLRGDDNEAYGKNETGGIALGHSIDRYHRVRASYGTAFRGPTFNDLYYPTEVYNDGSAYSGNPDLKPEESDAYEIGVGGSYLNWFWDLALYQMDVDNLIELHFDVPTLTLSPANVSKARIRGAELAAGLNVDGWRLATALAYTDPRDTETDNRLRRRSDRSMRVDLDHDFTNWSVGTTYHVQGERYDDAANTKKLAGYATLDLRASWAFARNWSTRLTVANVFDREYATAQRFSGAKYIAAGRTGMLSVRYDFQ
ncbi:TonB-dependent receptor domain-containing protein [Marinobacter zhejiangensis]|uniref:Vitamin B12 transporter n=1 Tax=Marinobacter zhejiangensis TaxID=488535 RepID=A0A1I4M711_9GAMM|nr:TonB-dependent receptor [Marinobacter zhejiangensis]SFL98757.1 vitamin B12 transporter [Marinobacter zhejiangensis]